MKISSFAGGAALLANVVDGGGVAGTGGELVYGKGLILGRSVCLGGTWGARVRWIYR